MDGVFVAHWTSIDATVEPNGVMRATDRRILGIGYRSRYVGTCKIRVGHHTRNRANGGRTAGRSTGIRSKRMYQQKDDQQGSDDAATPEASPLPAVDLRLTCYRTLLLLPALLT